MQGFAMALSGRWSALRESHAYDWAMRLPTALYSFYALHHDVIVFLRDAWQDPPTFDHADFGMIVATLARVTQWIFIALLCVLPLIRHRPIAKSEKLLPRLCALLTVLIPPLCMFIPRAPANLFFNLISVAVALTASVFAVIFLGRSFSVMPEARRL